MDPDLELRAASLLRRNGGVHGAERASVGGVSALSPLAVLFANSWEWDGKHWTIRQDMGPEPRWGHGMAFDTARNRGVLFGGTADAPQAPTATALGDTWEQFEQGVTVGPPPGQTVLVQSITANDGASEGDPVNVAVTLSGTPSAGSTVTLVLRDGSASTLLTQEFDASNLSINPLFLSEGTYTASATLGGSGNSTTFQVVIEPASRIVSLTASNNIVPSGSSFTPSATLTAAFTEGRTVPLRLGIPGVPAVPQIWVGEQLAITSGQTVGAVLIGEPLKPGLYTWTAMLGGGTASANVHLE